MRTISKCPKCGSFEVNTYRMLTGVIWCNKCGFRVEHKERDSSFYIQVEEESPVIEVK